MTSLSLLEWLWKGPLFLVGAFLVYFFVTYPFQRRWLTARVRTDDWLKGKILRGNSPEPAGFMKVGAAVEMLAESLKKLITNYRNTSRNKAMKGLRGEAKEIVISISESVTELLEHWRMLDGLDLVDEELKERAQRDRDNLVRLHENLDAFRASFQKAAVSQTSEVLTEASEKIAEISHFTKLMSESMGGETTVSRTAEVSE